MTLLDNESGREIINPYITLYSPDHKKWAALNTQTFGDAQGNLIHPLEEDRIMKLIKERRSLYPVVATVGKQNHPLESELSYMRGVRVEGADDALALIPLGFLLEEVVIEAFPKTFVYFNSAR